MPTPTLVGPDFAAWLRERRHRRALSQADLAVQVGVGARTIRAWEAGHARPSCRSLRLIAASLNAAIEELLELDPAPAAQAAAPDSARIAMD